MFFNIYFWGLYDPKPLHIWFRFIWKHGIFFWPQKQRRSESALLFKVSWSEPGLGRVLEVKFEELGLKWEDDTGDQSVVKYEELVTSTRGRDQQEGERHSEKQKDKQESRLELWPISILKFVQWNVNWKRLITNSVQIDTFRCSPIKTKYHSKLLSVHFYNWH